MTMENGKQCTGRDGKVKLFAMRLAPAGMGNQGYRITETPHVGRSYTWTAYDDADLIRRTRLDAESRRWPDSCYDYDLTTAEGCLEWLGHDLQSIDVERGDF